MRMRAHSTLILLVCEARGRLGLGVAVVVARHLRLRWWGVAVISSRGPGLVRVGLLPLIHAESDVAGEAPRGIVRRLAGRQGSRACLQSYLGSTKRRTGDARGGWMKATSDPRTRRSRKGSL